MPHVEPEITLDGGHVGAILQTAIGRKLMTRSLKLLSPPHRCVKRDGIANIVVHGYGPMRKRLCPLHSCCRYGGYA
jgi:hypothetical protein